jgi:ribonuclease D
LVRDFSFAAGRFPYIPGVIDTDKKLVAFLPHLRRAEWIGLDTEADSLHAYPEKLCLMQLSADGMDELIDPLAELKLKPVFDLLAQHELILHGADYDLRLLRRDCGFVPTSIFDTMLASRLLGCRQFGLVNLVQEFLGVTLEKGPQKANWARRPLTDRMEAYARNDTRYLKPLADFLSRDLKAKGRLSWHQQSCARLVAECSVPRAADPETVWRVKGSHQLSSRGLAVVRALWRWREEEAVAANKPPYFILPPEPIVTMAIAAVNGKNVEEAFPRYLTARRRKAVARAITVGLSDKEPPQPLRRKGHRLTEAEKRRLHDLERRRDGHATDLSIDPTLIASRSTLVALAADRDKNEVELLPWQRKLLT